MYISKYVHTVRQPISRTFSSCKTEALYPLSNNFPLLPPLDSGNHHSIFLSMNLTTLDTSYNWNHTIFVSFCDRLILLGGFPGGSAVENPPANAGDMGQEDPLKQEMATSSFCIWGCKKVRHNLVTKQQQLHFM